MDSKKLVRLVERARQGDEEAFAGIYSAFSKSVYYIALKMTKNEFDAKDIVQETMIRLYKNLHAIKDAHAVGAFVNRTAYRCCIDVLQKNKSLQMDEYMESALENTPDDDSEFKPEEFLAKKEQREAIVRMIEDLNESQKSVLLLFYFQQLSVKEIAEVLGIDSAAVKTRLSRARATLKQMLENSKVMVLSMLVFMLTKILQTDAQAAFSSEISVEIWNSLAEQLGYSAAAIATTTAIAATSGTVGGAKAAAGVTTSLGSRAPLTIAAVAIATTATIGAAVVLWNAPPETVGLAQQTAPSSSSFYSDVSSADTDYSDGAYIPSAVEQSAPQATIYHADTSASDGPSPADSRETGSNSAPEATTSGAPSDTEDFFPTAIEASHPALEYSAGQAISPEQIIADAGISFTGPDSEPLVPWVFYYESIDFATPNIYGVYVAAVDAAGDVRGRVAVIIIIT